MSARWVGCALLLTLPVAAAEPTDPKTLDVPAEKTKAAAGLIAKLDDDDVSVRGTASGGLKKMGRDALPAMLSALKAKPSNEVQVRLERLLPAARKADFDTRYPLFLADKAGKYDHDLLGWNELKAAVKDTKESRLLMTDILNDEQCRDMLTLSIDPVEGKTFEKRWLDKLNEWRGGNIFAQRKPKADAPIHWMPAALIADLLHEADYHSDYRHHVVLMYTETDEGKKMLADSGRYGGVVRVFTRFWVAQQTKRFGMRDAEAITGYLKLGEDVGRETAERRFEQFVEKGDLAQGVALETLAHTRDAKYIASFRRLFDSSAVYKDESADKKLAEIQVRDAALSMCIALSGQDPEEYGFAAQLKTKATDDMRYYVYNYRFAGDKTEADEKRTTAFKKWAAWEKANPDKIKAKPPEKK